MNSNTTKTNEKHSPFRVGARPAAIDFCGGNKLFVEQRSTANIYTPYKFSGKACPVNWGEKDEENSYRYFGARYYLSDISVWASVDPLADDAPGWTPYRYCFNNPINLIDPDGRSEDGWIKDKNNKVVWNDNATSQATTPKGCTYIGENNTDILRFYGFNFKISPLSTSRLGFIFLDDSEQGSAYHFVNVKVTSNLSIEANTNMDPKAVSADNKLGRVFNGINLTLSNSSTNSGTSEGEIEAGGSFSVNYGGKDYTGKAQAMNASSLFGTGSTNTRSTVSLPSSELKTYKRLYSAEVSGSWGARRAGEGYSPVVWHGLVPIPRTYWHRWTF